jgi:hypothetical protein
LVRNVELWLPSAFEFTFEGEDVDGRRIIVGSATTLRRQQSRAQDATWKANASVVDSWGAMPCPTIARSSRTRAMPCRMSILRALVELRAADEARL